MRHILILIIVVIGFSSCSFKEISATQYREVQINGQKQSRTERNYVDIYKGRGDAYLFMFYRDDTSYQRIDAISDGKEHISDDVIHYIFTGKDKKFIIDMSPSEVSILNIDATVTTFTKKCKK